MSSITITNPGRSNGSLVTPSEQLSMSLNYTGATPYDLALTVVGSSTHVVQIGGGGGSQTGLGSASATGINTSTVAFFVRRPPGQITSAETLQLSVSINGGTPELFDITFLPEKAIGITGSTSTTTETLDLTVFQQSIAIVGETFTLTFETDSSLAVKFVDSDGNPHTGTAIEVPGSVVVNGVSPDDLNTYRVRVEGESFGNFSYTVFGNGPHNGNEYGVSSGGVLRFLGPLEEQVEGQEVIPAKPRFPWLLILVCTFFSAASVAGEMSRGT